MKKLIEKMLILDLSPRREFLIAGGVDLLLICLSIALGIIGKNLVFAVICAGIAIVFSVLYFSRYGTKIDKINRENLEDFTNIFSYFKIYIRNGYSVYSALKEIVLFANPALKILLEKLISDIDNDKTVQPYVKFAKNFNEIIVEEMMISIYQMVDDGEQSEYLGQFELIFDKFSELMHEKNLRQKDSKLGTLSSAPLLGSCFLIIALTLGVISIIGGMINGL